MAGIYGGRCKFGIGTASLTLGTRFEIVSEGLRNTEELVSSNGIRGTRSHSAEGVRSGIQRISGPVVFQPTAVELVALLPWILGGTPSGTSFPLAETVDEKYVFIQRGDGTDGKVFEYSGCKVTRAVFSASRGQQLTVTLDLVGRTETVNVASAFPSGSIDTTTQPFMFSDLVLSVGGTSYSTFDFELSVDNAIDGEAFLNSVTVPRELQPTDRIVSFVTNLPYGDAEATYALTATGVAVVATFTNGATSLVFSLPKVSFPRESPVVSGKQQEIQIALRGTARKDGSTAELAVTLDSTP